jgi:phosphoenolpyruvate-protein phosphotransferase/dihydroxyacetone kinase phosphotransfer subunit
MVAIVLVSHSKALANAARELASQMSHPDTIIAVAAGAGENHDELGTDPVHISQTIEASYRPDGVVVLMDLGSAILSTETALELLDPQIAQNVRLCPGPLVEGVVAAAVQAGVGAPLETVANEARRALVAKEGQLNNSSSAQSPNAPPVTRSAEASEEITITVANPNGLHARPAAALVQAVGKFSAGIEITNETGHRGPASARSLSSLALLQIRKGDRIKVRAAGPDAAVALLAVEKLAGSNFGEETFVSATLRDRVSYAHGASRGIAIGPLWVLHRSLKLPQRGTNLSPSDEFEKLNTALRLVHNELSTATEILQAQSLLLQDPVLQDQLKNLIQEERLTAVVAWSRAIQALIQSYESLDDPYLKERAADVRDLGDRVLRRLTSVEHTPIKPPEPSIVLVDELLPSEAAECRSDLILGVLSEKGSPTSHSALLLNTLGIPMVTGVTGLANRISTAKIAALDGETGEFWIDPDPSILAELNRRKEAAARRQTEARRFIEKPCFTEDGQRLEILANAGSEADARTAKGNGAEGIGLLRTEFLFLEKTEAPTEDEHQRLLRAVLDAAPSGVTVIRTLDAGADKPITFLPQEHERNPFLGVRGIRLLLAHRDFFRSHARAILRAGLGKQVWLMLPMISDVTEVGESRQILLDVHRELEREHIPHLWPVKLGAMIEVPSAAILANQLAGILDFFSIGTNDLTQYVMAAERGSTSLSHIQDAVHPAVLRTIESIVKAAKRKGIHVSVCGDAASDPLAAALFVGLGIRSLSVRPQMVPEIKAFFANYSSANLRALATNALDQDSAAAVRSGATEALAVQTNLH